MSVFVFLGPSLSQAKAQELMPDAAICPPVSQGDVARAVRAGARAIGIIDGYFERVPAVWHKEILWAMSQGVHVFGASSMGALRAAELHDFGMIGIGVVFATFRDGLLEDDDEVTVVHGPAESGYLQGSVAMVDIRATLMAALGQGILSDSTHAALVGQAKAIFYPERSYPALLQCAETLGLPADEMTALKAWLPNGKVAQKAADATEMLTYMAGFLSQNPPPNTAQYHFERTDAWEQVLRRDGHQIAAALPDALPSEGLVDEIRLLGGDRYAHVLSEALGRAMALREVNREKAAIDPAIFRETLHGFFINRGMSTPEDIGAWLTTNRLDTDTLTAFMRREVGIEQIKTAVQDDIMSQLADVLRAMGLYGTLIARAEDKQRWLTKTDLHTTALSDWDQDETSLLSWHFSDRHNNPAPADLETYARALGLENRHAFLQLLLRDYLYERRGSGQRTE